MKGNSIQKDKKQLRNSKLNAISKVAIVMLKIYAIIVVISGCFFTGKAIIESKEQIKNTISANRLALTYDEVGEDENSTQSPYVKFDAYFLKKDGSSVKKVRGDVLELNERQELQIELNVLTNGHIEDGQIKIRKNNFSIAKPIVEDQEIHEVCLGSTEINLNEIQNGTYKTIPVLIEQNSSIGRIYYKGKLSGVNSVIFTATHVAEDGTKTKIEKTVDFKLDWYGSKKLAEINLYRKGYIVNQEDQVYIRMKAEMWSEDRSNTIIQVPSKAAVLSSTLPLLNGYAPIEVIVKNSSDIETELTYTYDSVSRKLEVREESCYRESDGQGSVDDPEWHYGIDIDVTYPYEAYQKLDASTRILNFTVKGYIEGYNNPNEGFSNPTKSKEGSSTVGIDLKHPDGDCILYNVEITNLEKTRLRLKYDRDIEEDNGYCVRWSGYVQHARPIEKIIMEEENEKTPVDGRKFITDQALANDGTYYDWGDLVEYTGVWISYTSGLFEKDGYINVIDADTGEIVYSITGDELIEVSHKKNIYKKPVKRIRVETSKPQFEGNIHLYHYKRINKEAFVKKYTKEQFNNMISVYTAMSGSVETKGEKQFINRDVDSGDYREGGSSFLVGGTIALNTQMLNQGRYVKVGFSTSNYYAAGASSKSWIPWINPTIILEYPEEIESVDIKDIFDESGNLVIKEIKQENINNKEIIRIKTEGFISDYGNIQIRQNITMNGTTQNTTGKLRVFAYNQLCDSWYSPGNGTEEEDIYDINEDGNTKEKRMIGIVNLFYERPKGIYTNIQALNFDNTNKIIMAPEIAEIEKNNRKKEATIRLNVYNNYNTAVTNAKIVGKIPFKGNTYQINGGDIGSQFTTTMKEDGIQLPDNIKEKVEVYYSTHETVNENLNDSSNGWTKTPNDWSKIRTYLIDLSKIVMNSGDKYTMEYDIKFPEEVNYDNFAYATHAIYFEENTENGKVPRSTETSKVGFYITSNQKYQLQLSKLQKQTNKNVSGVRYKIEGPGLNEGIYRTTGEDGKITISSLYPETIYTLTEIYAPKEYVLEEEPIQLETYLENGELKARVISGTVKQEPVVENGNTTSPTVKIEVENEAKYDFSITKYKKGTEETIANVRFNLKGKGFSETGKVVATDNQGKASITGLCPNEIYTLEEIFTSSDYVLDSSLIQFKAMETNGQLSLEMINGTFKTAPTVNNETREIEVGVENEAKYELEIIKYKKGTDEKISDTSFCLKGEGFREAGENITTDENGIAQIEKLIPGEEYTLQEVKANSDFMLDNQVIKFKVVRDAEKNLSIQILEGDVRKASIEDGQEAPLAKIAIDNEIRYQIEINKQEAGTSNALEGVNFIVKGKDFPAEGGLFTTGEYGKITITSLELGEIYTIKESYAKGYYVDEKEFTVKVERIDGELRLVCEGVNAKEEPVLKQEPNQVPSVQIILENQKIPTYSLELTKVAKETGKLLQGAKFEVTGKGRDTTEEKEYISAENGKFTIENLYVNEEYTLTEVMEPIGYKLDETPIKFKVIQTDDGLSFTEVEGTFLEPPIIEGNVVKVKKENEPQFKLEKKDGETGKPIQGAKFTIKDLDGNNAKDVSGNEIGTIENIDGEEKRVVTTDENGVITEEIAEGLYEVTEVKPANGYKLPRQTTQYFGINRSQEAIKNLEIKRSVQVQSGMVIERVIPTDDGGFWAVGTGLIIRCDKEYQEVWSEEAKNASYADLIEDGQGGFVVVGFEGYTGSIAKYKKVSSNSYELEWKRSVGTKLASVIRKENGNFVIAGSSSGSGIIVEYDARGKVANTINVNGTNPSYSYECTSIVQTLDGGFLVGGASRGDHVGFVKKYDRNYKVIWEREANGSRVCAVAETSDNMHYVMGGYFKGTITIDGKTYTSKAGGLDAIIIQYDKNGKVEWVKTYGGAMTDLVNYVTSTRRNNIVAVIKVSGPLDIEGEQIITNGVDGAIVEYNVEGKIVYKTFFRGARDNYATVIKETVDGKLIAGIYNNGSLTLQDGKTYNTNGIVIEIEENVLQPAVKNTKEINFSNFREEYDIYTKVEGTGGSISGYTSGDEALYESVLYQESSKKDITITPQTGYQVNKITVNGEEVSFKREADGKVLLNKFENMSEDKHVVVTFTANPAEVIVHHYIDGTTTRVPLTDGTSVEDEYIYGEIGKTYETHPKENLEKYQLVSSKLPTNAEGTMQSETEEVIYYYELKEAKVIVHHYKDGTEEPLAEDEIIEGRVDDHYQTNAKTDISGYRVVESKLPENAEGIMTEETTEITYYYNVIPKGTVTVHHYIEGTRDPILLPDGTEVLEETIEGEEGSAYTTQPKLDLEKYELVEEKLPANGSGTITDKPIEVIYYYKAKTVKITTEVEGVGGSISGQGENPYEIVEYGEDSIKDLIITPDKYYRVSKITINGQEVEFIEDMHKEVYLNPFTQMKEDKHIVVSFEKITAGKVTVKYLEYGTNKELLPSEQKAGNVGDSYATKRKEIEGYKAFGLDPMNANGTLTEEAQEVIYYYMRATGTVTIKYMDVDTGKEIAEQEMMSGYVGEEYTTIECIKEIERYTFAGAMEENETGSYVEGNIEVIYLYRKIPAKVIVQYLEKGTNQVLAREEVVNGEDGDPYDVTDLEKDIKGYNKVEEKPENKEGTMTVEDITVIYYYERKQANITENKIEKEGTSKLVIPVENEKVSYTITYRAQIVDYMGNAEVTIIDYLPYEIDGESAKLDGGTYNQSQKTITWKETIENIDTYDNGNKEIVITKQIEVVYKNLDFSKEGFVNKAKGKITLDTTSQEKETLEVEKETKFEKPGIELATTVEKTGDEKITSTEAPIYYQVNYTATINHFIGKAVIRFVDQLPYAIDEEKSDLSNFGTKTTIEELGPGKYVYNAEEKTITWEEVVEDINTFQALEAKVLNKTKSFSVQYIYDNNGETLSGNLVNTVKATTNLVETKTPEETPEQPKEEIVKTEEKQDEHSVAVEIPTKVTVHHYIYNKEKDEYTTIKVPSVTAGQVVQDEEKEGLVGKRYTTAKSNQVAKNYEVVSETPDKHEGIMTKTPIEVIYYYQLKDETVTSKITKTAKADKTIERENQDNEGTITKEQVEVLTTDGGAIRYNISYKVKIENYIGKAKVTIVDTLPTKINLENVDLKGGHYDRLNNTITWEEEITGIDTFAEGKAFEKTITKEIELVYEGQNKIEPITNKVTGTVKTYYPDDYPVDPSNPEDPENPTKEKETQTKEDTETVEQEYKVSKTVEKVWEDNEDAKGKRPASVSIQLTANSQTVWEGQTLENTILSDDNHWSHTFENLPKYDRLGNEISYSIEESEVNQGDLEYYEIPEITSIEDQNKIMVTNSYRLVNTQLESSIEKTGTDKVTSTKQEVNYHIHYTANIEDYIGEAIVTITDTLPYHIDSTKSDLAGGTYNEDTKTITWTKNLGHINATEANTNIEAGIYPVSIEKDITLYYTDIITTEDKMTNNVKGKIEFTENDTKNEVTDTHETLIDIKGRVITKYVEKATGKEIEERKDEEGKVGLEYSAYPKTIYGYNFIEDSGNTVGKVIEGTIEIIFYYEKKDAGNVIVKYVDEEGKELVPQETIEGKVGDAYKTEAKELDEYELEKVTGAPEEGTLDESRKEVVYHYKKRPAKVIVRYLEKGTDKPLALEETKEGKIGDSYETTRKVIEGYQKAEPEPENANGTMTKEDIIITYYYEKIPSGKITVKYIEYDTKQEITYQDEEGEKKSYTYEISGYVGDKYETSEKEIPYYEYLSNLEPSNKTGIYKQDDDTVIYYYRKLPFNMKVEKKLKGAMVDNIEYNIGKNEKLTKIEVAASEIGKTKVEVKYVIKVSNTGEIEGTAKVVDRVPAGFKIASSNPNYWKVQKDGSLVTTVELKKKETKELEVILNWKNGNSNFGSMRNQAEIVETSNPANYLETELEDNISEATVVMSIKTGKQKQVLVTALGTIASSGLLVLLYQYQRYQKERGREIRHVVLEGKDVVIKKKKQR